jgi:integrase
MARKSTKLTRVTAAPPAGPQDDELSRRQALGELANRYAGAAAFDDYTSRKSRNTIRAQAADLQTFAEYMAEIGDAAGVTGIELQSSPQAWAGVTWGIVEGYLRWLLRGGYSISSVNRKLSTIKVYAKLANKADIIPAEGVALIRNISGYSLKEGKRVDERRAANRVGAKKAANTTISPAQAKALKAQPDTPQGRRDGLLMCLLLDHGLRVGEAARLQAGDVDLARGLLVFYRPKVDKRQTHRLTDDSLRAVQRWFHFGHAPTDGPLLRGSRKGGHLDKPGMSERAITARVRTLGEEIGLFGLSAHDCRHYWATIAARSGTDPFALRDAGGWNSLAMPSRYVEEQEIANAGVRLESGD